MTRVAAYCRVSTDKTDQANSFEAQQRYFWNCIDRNPEWILQDIYADEGLSGTNTKKRKQFLAMIRAAQDGKIDLIITKEVSRFARNTLDTLEYTRALKKIGVGILFLIDNINTLDADGELRLTIMASLAQEESRKTSHRVKWGQEQSMQKGVVFGGSLLGYDVENGNIQVNPDGAKTVRYIYQKYLIEHKGSTVIARELQEEGIVSSRGNHKWSAPTVLKILKNEKYCGDLIQKKTYTPDYLSHEKKYNRGQEPLIIIRDHHEPIIDRATWNAEQQELSRRHRVRKQHVGHGNQYSFSGKIKCSHCGSSFLCRTKKVKSGKSYRIWRCGKATTEGRRHTDSYGTLLGCDIGKQIREETAIDILKSSVEALQTDTEAVVSDLTCIIADVMNTAQNATEAEKQRLEHDLNRQYKKKKQAMDALLDETLSKSDFQLLNEQLNNCITQINHQISKLETHQKTNYSFVESIEDIRAAIKSIVKGERGADKFYGRLLQQMTVFGDGKVEVTLHSLSARWIYELNASKRYFDTDISQ